MNKLLLEFLKNILNERVLEPRKDGKGTPKKPRTQKMSIGRIDVSIEDQTPGTVQRTKGGRFRAKQVGTNKVLYWGDENMAKAWAQGKKDTTDSYEDDARIGANIPKDLLGRKAKPTPSKTAPEKKTTEPVTSLNPEELRRIEDEYVEDSGAESDEMSEEFGQTDYAERDLPDTYSDDVYYSEQNGGRGHSTKVRKPPFKFDDETRGLLENSGFPRKYIRFLERCINTQMMGTKPPVTELVDVGGAGQIASQFGEVVSMAMMSIRDPQERRKFAEIIKTQIGESKLDFVRQKLGEKAFAELRKDPKKLKKVVAKVDAIADADWVDSAATHAQAFDAAMDEKYGQGNWTFEGASWDIRSDVESLGLPYENKGFSTDVILRVNTPEGPKAQRVSLKKDENIMFFNGSVGEINNFILNYIDERSRKRLKGLEQLVFLAGPGNKNKERQDEARAALLKLTGQSSVSKALEQAKSEISSMRDSALKSAPPEVQRLVSDINSFSSTQLNAGIELAKNVHNRNAEATAEEVTAAIEAEFSGKEPGDREYARLAWDISQQCVKEQNFIDCAKEKLQSAGEDTATDRVAKLCVFAGRVASQLGDEASTSELENVYEIGRDIGRRMMEIIPEHEELMGGVMQKLASAFPLRVCMDGTEMMLIDGIKITSETLRTVFGTDDYSKLQKGLDIVRLPNGESVLVYKMESPEGVDGTPITIGYVQGRQKGLGYTGTVGFEILCSDEFALACATANKSNGDTSESNEDAVNRISGRTDKRKKKSKGK